MRDHSGLQYYAPQLISDDGKCTFYSTGDALADPDKRRRLAELLFGPLPR
jgi:hypothetical protein